MKGEPSKSSGCALDFEFVVEADHPAIAGHFPGRPIVPGVLILDQVLARAEAVGRMRARALVQAKFAQPMLPGESVQVRYKLDASRLRFQVSTQRDGVWSTVASGILSIEGLGEAGA